MTKIFNRRKIKVIRKILRNKLTISEVILWSKIKHRQINNCKFRRQHSIGIYIIDFYCPAFKLAIELDGSSHFMSKVIEQQDQERQNYIENQGIKVLRFLNTDIFENLDDVLETITSATTPNPSLERRGLIEKILN